MSLNVYEEQATREAMTKRVEPTLPLRVDPDVIILASSRTISSLREPRSVCVRPTDPNAAYAGDNHVPDVIF